MKFKVSVPATSANIGPGYDIWGLSLGLRNDFIVQVLPEHKSHIVNIHPGDLLTQTSLKNPLQELENPNENLFIRCYNEILLRSGFEPYHLSVDVKLEIPLSRGLGSSSTAIVGGLLTGNEILRKFSKKAHDMKYIYDLAAELEGHPDNIAPALYGGLVLNIKDERKNVLYPVSLDFKCPVKFAGVIPHITLSTSDARKVIGKSHPLETTIFQSSRTALLTHLFSKETWTSSEKNLFHLALDDRIHQVPRSVLIPGMKEAFQHWVNQGALGAYLSGAGSTLLAFWPADADLTKVDFRQPLLNHGIESTVFTPGFDSLGSTIEHLT